MKFCINDLVTFTEETLNAEVHSLCSINNQKSAVKKRLEVIVANDSNLGKVSNRGIFLKIGPRTSDITVPSIGLRSLLDCVFLCPTCLVLYVLP